MHLDTAQFTAIGTRETNEDALAWAYEDELACFVLADGTGGHAGGELAAQVAIDAIMEKFVQDASFSARALRSYLEWAIVKVAESKRISGAQKLMSTTIATVLIDQSNRSALWAHMGDTRIYQFRQGRIKAVSKDHSQAQRLVDAGCADYAYIRRHPQRNMLFAAIGAEGESSPEVTAEAIELRDGDAFLMCTDGFWEWVHEHEMEFCLATAGSSEAWLSKMNAIAEKNISTSKAINRDNFSAFAICVHEDAVKN
ncbi:PP2C family serine/threonine-protein phosphatase [Undibacterium sp. TS12]|uniref:PP2C family protein-serine/threonine phosphatase n=1 Tax=Undibacterium sp. TS12 TaxID=2908202 RepID=UPI001F4CA022|nr:PP2C family serine/threonine-protein phosphatase [Undibacterium sp. TS12]MCH8617980.1 serine/threonine-protein phosphatase [Undibacterium sp. TS12]